MTVLEDETGWHYHFQRSGVKGVVYIREHCVFEKHDPKVFIPPDTQEAIDALTDVVLLLNQERNRSEWYGLNLLSFVANKKLYLRY